VSRRARALLSWSSGKDSAWSLHVLRQQRVEVVGLLTTVNETFGRVAMHAVRETLLEKQADAAGVPLWKVPIPHRCSNDDYEKAMAGVIERARSEGITAVAFGDLFLADIRAYREKQLAGTGIEPLFPIWGLPTAALAREMVAAGVRARITCVDPKQMPRRFVGRVFDGDLLDELPETVDPCGERGEFHTFCYAGPMFREPVDVALGETTERDGFVFADLR
jgi:uncharacterized protein (TIGR00290 family)